MKRRTYIVDHKYENTRSLRLLENVNKFHFIYQRLLTRSLFKHAKTKVERLGNWNSVPAIIRKNIQRLDIEGTERQ